MELVNVVAETQEQQFRLDVRFAPRQESVELPVLFQHAERSLRLDGAVYAKLRPHFDRYVFKRLLAVGDEFLGNLHAPVAFGFIALNVSTV